MYRKHISVGKFVSSEILLLTILLFSFGNGLSQSTIVRGKVTDQDTGQPVPFISVVFENTIIGAKTDTLGLFQIISKEKVDSVKFSSIGYISKTIGIKPAATTELIVKLKADLIKISEVKVKPDYGPERRILKEMTDHKNQNNPSKYPRYSYRKYTKWEYHLRNVGDKMFNSKVFRNHQSLFKTDSDSSRYLPIYFSEQLVFNEFQRNPSKQKSTVLADKTSGVGVLDEYEISGYTSALDIEVNFYDNFINLFSQNFVSPLADNGWFYYKYFLTDSTFQNGRKEYKIRFIPRRVGDKVFKGYMITEDKNYSIVEIDGALSNTSYLNFLKSMRLKSNYQFVKDSIPCFQEKSD